MKVRSCDVEVVDRHMIAINVFWVCVWFIFVLLARLWLVLVRDSLALFSPQHALAIRRKHSFIKLKFGLNYSWRLNLTAWLILASLSKSVRSRLYDRLLRAFFSVENKRLIEVYRKHLLIAFCILNKRGVQKVCVQINRFWEASPCQRLRNFLFHVLFHFRVCFVFFSFLTLLFISCLFFSLLFSANWSNLAAATDVLH